MINYLKNNIGDFYYESPQRMHYAIKMQSDDCYDLQASMRIINYVCFGKMKFHSGNLEEVYLLTERRGMSGFATRYQYDDEEPVYTKYHKLVWNKICSHPEFKALDIIEWNGKYVGESTDNFKMYAHKVNTKVPFRVFQLALFTIRGVCSMSREEAKKCLEYSCEEIIVYAISNYIAWELELDRNADAWCLSTNPYEVLSVFKSLIKGEEVKYIPRYDLDSAIIRDSGNHNLRFRYADLGKDMCECPTFHISGYFRDICFWRAVEEEFNNIVENPDYSSETKTRLVRRLVNYSYDEHEDGELSACGFTFSLNI